MAEVRPLPEADQAPDRIPLEEVYMRMAEELAKRSTCARLQVGTRDHDARPDPGPRHRLQRQRPGPAQPLRLDHAGNVRLHSLASRTRSSRRARRCPAR